MKHSEFWARMNDALGEGFAQVWADTHVMPALGSRTVNQALAAGDSPKQIWAVVWSELELPSTLR